MTEIKEKQLKLIDETAAFYNSKNLCFDNDGCYYWTAEHPEGCAVGRLCSLEKRKELVVFGGTAFTVFAVLPPEIQVLGDTFLRKLQTLHDTYQHWDEEGLTDSGKRFVLDFKKEILEGLYEQLRQTSEDETEL